MATLLYVAHVLCAVVWVGGMVVALAVLRPAAHGALDGPQRLALMDGVFHRFFRLLWHVVPILLLTGWADFEERSRQPSGAPAAPTLVTSQVTAPVLMRQLTRKKVESESCSTTSSTRLESCLASSNAAGELRGGSGRTAGGAWRWRCLIPIAPHMPAGCRKLRAAL